MSRYTVLLQITGKNQFTDYCEAGKIGLNLSDALLRVHRVIAMLRIVLALSSHRQIYIGLAVMTCL